MKCLLSLYNVKFPLAHILCLGLSNFQLKKQRPKLSVEEDVVVAVAMGAVEVDITETFPAMIAPSATAGLVVVKVLLMEVIL